VRRVLLANQPGWDGSRSSTSGRREQIGIRAFVVNLLVVIMGLFIGLVLLDLINILTITHASAHVAGKVFLRVALAGADPLVLIRISPANAKKKESRRADSNRFPAPATSLLAYILARTGASGNSACLGGFRRSGGVALSIAYQCVSAQLQ
jgi:hypothetical protein